MAFILNTTKFEVKNINESVGVMAIVGKRRYEHATFRKEVYESESHSPDQIEFIDSYVTASVFFVGFYKGVIFFCILILYLCPNFVNHL